MTTAPRLSLQQQLAAAPRGFTFAQVVDLLEHAHAGAAPLGQGSAAAAEALRLCASFTLAFQPGAIDQLRAGADGRPELVVNFLGLGNADGPLPEMFVELIERQLRAQAGAAAAFLDIFQHRLLSLAYRAENEMRFAAPYCVPARSAFAPALRALIGLPPHATRPRLERILLAHAGIVVQQRRSLSGLMALLRAHFGVAVEGEQFHGRWVDLPDELQTVLGDDGRNDLLGAGAVLGQRAWDQNGAVWIALRQLPLDMYESLLPRRKRYHELSTLCAWFLGAHVECHVQLQLEALPPALQDAAAEGEDSPYALGGAKCRLGETSWLRTGAASVEAQFQCITLVLNTEAAS